MTINNLNYDLYERKMKEKGIKWKFIEGMKPYHGSQWWSLTRSCICYILQTVGNKNKICTFYRYSKFPDEQFFQTLVMNSEFSSKAVNNGLRNIEQSHVDLCNIDWNNKPPHPKILTMEDFQSLYGSPALFARKFDEKENIEN